MQGLGERVLGGFDESGRQPSRQLLSGGNRGPERVPRRLLGAGRDSPWDSVVDPAGRTPIPAP